MIGRQDRYSGNILLYDYLSLKRAPTFLNRNLTRALRVHQHVLQNGSTENFPGPDHDLRSEWGPPSWDALDDMVEQEKSRGSFVLEIHGFKPLNANPTGWGLPVRKTRSLFCVKSTIYASIFAKPSNQPCKVPPQQATVKGVDNNRGRRVYVEMDRIVIKPEDLSISNDAQRLSFDESCKLMLSVNFDEVEDATELYKHMGVMNAENDSHTRLSSIYKNILECPDGTTILPLKDHKGRLDFGIEVSMYWMNTEGSILSAHNQQTRISAQPRSYPTPPLDMDKPKFKLTFVYAREKIERTSLVCPHERCHKRKPTGIEDLRMHLDSWHDYFRYKPIEEGVDDDGVEHWRFECEVSDHKVDQRARDRADEPFDVHVMAPPQPFNQQQFVTEGNDEYQRTARLERPPKYVSRIPTSLRRKPPDEIQERPPREKKRFPVPKAPEGVVFFRSFCKRPLKEGEVISESDDEVEESWIDLRKAAEDHKNAQLSDTARRFLAVFDKFMREEHLQSDVHAGDALIRFARERGAWLWHEHAYDEFQTKINELLEDGIITNEVHAGCLEIVQSHKPSGQEANELSQRLAGLDVQSTTGASAIGRRRSKRDRKGKGKAKVTDTGHLTPITADSDGDVQMRDASGSDPPETLHEEAADPPYDLCLCGADALVTRCGPSPIIACSGIVSNF